MSYQIVLVVVPSDMPNPVDWAYILMDPFCHTEDCRHSRKERERRREVNKSLTRQHFWDSSVVGGIGGHQASGCLWCDRYGRKLSDHPINGPEDEIRRVADVDLCLLRLSPTALVTPDGNIYFMGKPDSLTYTIAEFIKYEDRLGAYPEHLTVPMTCFK